MKFSLRKKRFLIGIIILIICIFLLNLFQKDVRNFFYTISAPIQKVFWGAGDRVSDFFGAFIRVNNLKKERNELTLKNQELLTQAALLEKLKEENKVLREALGIELQKEFKLIISQTIEKDVSQDFILIDKGSKEGVSKGMPVITQQKVLVGRIVEVYENFSKVMLISNEKSSFDAKIQRGDYSPPAARGASAKAEEGGGGVGVPAEGGAPKDISGVIKGEGNFKILFDLIPREEEIFPGDTVITSSLAGIFPEGLLVGEVKEVEKSDVETFQKAKITPAFNISQIEILFVVTFF